MDNHPATAPRLTRWRRFRESVDIWHISAASGLLAAALAWTIWYFSKIPCTMELARAGACNPNALANLITLPALTSILAIGAGVATLVGGYSYAMVSKANRRADEAELRLQQERERNDAERERNEAERQLERERNNAERQLERERNNAERQRQQERYDLLLDELRAERQQSTAAQQQSAEAQQAMIAALAEIGASLTRWVEQQQNGRHNDNG